jgi:glycerol-3-phosphate cytidylyltransferase
MTEIVGYTTGVFDLFHVGHLNILTKAKQHCDQLIVGVTTDELAEKLKGKRPAVPFADRLQTVQEIGCVDKALAEDIDDKIAAFEQLQFNIIFKGDDWKGSRKWKLLEPRFLALGVKVVYFPYTNGVSSTLLRDTLDQAGAV